MVHMQRTIEIDADDLVPECGVGTPGNSSCGPSPRHWPASRRDPASRSNAAADCSTDARSEMSVGTPRRGYRKEQRWPGRQEGRCRRYRRATSPASRSVVARPMPLPPPVTIAPLARQPSHRFLHVPLVHFVPLVLHDLAQPSRAPQPVARAIRMAITGSLSRSMADIADSVRASRACAGHAPHRRSEFRHGRAT